jgi:hypothetical protein
MKVSILSKILTLLLLSSCMSCGEYTLSGDRYIEVPGLKGRVLDYEDNLPIKNALITVYWFERRVGTLHGGPGFAILNMHETYSDDKGFFHLKSWNYKRRGSWVRPELRVDLSIYAGDFGLQSSYDFERFEAGYFSKNYISSGDGVVDIFIRQKDIQSASQVYQNDAYIRLIYTIAAQKSCLLLNVRDTIKNFNSLVEEFGGDYSLLRCNRKR